MCADTSLSETVKTIEVDGRAEIAFARRDGVTRLTHLFQHDPIRVLFPNAGPGKIFEATIITTSGGLVGGDNIAIEIKAEPDTRALITTQAAEKIYRSTGKKSGIDILIDAQKNAWLEWLPQETILFDGAMLSRKISINAAPGAKILAGEILVLGRTGSGETYASGFLRDVWHIHRQDRLVWADALCLDKNIPDLLSHPACFNGATAQATAIYICDDPEEHLDEARGMITSADDAVLSSATIVNGILILRWLGKDAYHLRQAFAEFWKSFRHFAGGEVPELPKIWSV